jgi:Zn-dependent peptidase ImmA (M78 family)
MGLNELFFLHQVALMNAERTDDHGLRQKHEARANCFAAKIENLQQRLGAPGTPLARLAQI